MPEELERRLQERARKLFPGDKKRQDRYTYGTLRKTGWKPVKVRRAVPWKRRKGKR